MAKPAVAPPLARLPNALSIARLALVPIFVVLVLAADGGHSWLAGAVFATAGVTDQVDGWLARRWRVESQFGKIVDPLADRLMIDAAVILLVIADRLPWAALAIVAARDAFLLVGYRLFAPRGVEIDVNTLGKAATWILYASIGFVLVTHASARWPLWVFWSGVAGALAAAALYAVEAWKTVQRRPAT